MPDCYWLVVGQIEVREEVSISKNWPETTNLLRPESNCSERDLRLVVLSVAIHAGETSGEAVGFNVWQHLLCLKEQRSKR